MIIGIHHLGLAVPSLDRAAAFYRAAYGLAERRRFPLADGEAERALLGLSRADGRAALLAGPNMHLELMAFVGAPAPTREERAPSAGGIGHFCAQGPDMGPLATRLRAAGARFDAEPTDLGADILYAYPRDPDGNLLEIESVSGTAEREGPWFAHVSLSTPDLDRAVRFWEAFTGVGARRGPRLGPHPKIDRLTGLDGAEVSGAWLRLPNAQLELWQYHVPETRMPDTPRPFDAPGWNHLAFEVGDVPAERVRLEGLGMRFRGEPLVGEAATVAYGEDPDGNIVELMAFREAARELSIAALPDPGVVSRVEAARAGARAA